MHTYMKEGSWLRLPQGRGNTCKRIISNSLVSQAYPCSGDSLIYSACALLCVNQAHGEGGAQAYEEKVVKNSMAWKEWYGKRLIASWGPDASASPSFISRCAGDLTNFLSRLPPTKSADCLLLSTYLAKLVYPESPNLQDMLVKETMMQLSAKRKEREVR